MRSCWFVLLMAGCGDSAGGLPDATADAMPDAFSVCFGSASDSRVCFAQAPAFAPLSLPTAIDTRTGCASDVLEPNACVLVADSITIDTRIVVTGARPLILLARDSITLTSTGALDLSSTTARVAAGARTCMPASGAGGTLGGTGGAGEHFATAAKPLTTLVGGCIGGIGLSVTGPGGTPGFGGGAVALIAPTITIAGVINASGALGRGCGPVNYHGGCGGGGGGSGGMIVVDATTLSGSGTLLANGGGGGSAESGFQLIAPDGSAPAESAPLARAPGGDRDADGVGPRGGGGAAGTTTHGEAGTSETTGPVVHLHYGGGGGGAGIIRIHGDNTGFSGPSSPPPNQPAP